ncbi:MAG: multidrug effflux MFS transporter [Polaromonas sp.]|nr:multidrug effflux MFS transporter [Gemmatimonadaceae bacterium]
MRPHSVFFTLLLGALVTLSSFATDMGLPVLAATAQSLGVSPARAALSLSVFIAGFAVGPLVFGPLSDRFGRRPILLGGCAFFALFGSLGAFAQSIQALLLWRTLMGIGAGTVQVLVLATVRDLFTGREARTKQAYVNMAGGIAPIIAPTLGILVAGFGGWRAIYGVLAAGGIVLWVVATVCLRETAPVSAHALSVRRTLANYACVMRHPVSVGNALVVALSFGSLFAFVSGSSLVLIGVLGASQRVYGLLFAVTSLGLVTGAFTSARLTRRGVSHARLIGVGVATTAAITVILLILSATAVLRLTTFIPLVVLANIATGVTRPNAAQGALEPMPEIVGVASALLSGLQMLVGAVASALAVSLFDGRTAIAMTATMAVCSVSAALVYLLVVRRAERAAITGGTMGSSVTRAA